MRRSERRTALRSHLHAPRSVRVRLTVLYGVVVFLAGASLLGITFLLGGHQSVQVSGVIFRSQSSAPPLGAVAFPAGIAPGGESSSSSGGSLTITAGGGGPGGLAASQAQVAARIGSSSAVHNLFFWGGIGLLIVTLAGIGIGWEMSGRMLRPLRTMTNTTRHISEENLHERLALSGPRGDELKELGDTIDGLLSRLEAAFDAQGRFVQNASHELRTPIAMMRTSLDVATGKPGGAPPEVMVLANKLGEGLDQAERLLESFLVLARVQNGSRTERVPIGLSDAVRDAFGEYREVIEGLGLSVELSLDDATVSGNATLVARVIENLIDNAIRHNVPGGFVRLTTETEGTTVRLCVENGGALLDQGDVARLGQPFQRLAADRTASDRGVGLGLSIVAAIAASHGGTLELSARAEGGLRALVELPAVARVSDGGAAMRVLVAEDVRRMADDIAEGLRDQGMAVDVAYDGADASVKLDVNTYDVVVLDRDLPGVHGDTICRRIAEEEIPVMVLMLTAAGAPGERVAGLMLGADDYLAKPFHFPELVLRVRALARRKPGAHARVLRFAGIELDPMKRTVTRDGLICELTPKEFAVLEALLGAESSVVSAEVLLEHAWDEHTDPFTRTVSVTISRLRKKLGDPPAIETVPGVGYRLSTTL